MSLPPKPFPRRFSISILLSIIITLLVFYTNLCLSPTDSRPGILNRDYFSHPFNSQLHGAHRQESASPDDDPDILPTTAHPTTTTTITTTTTTNNKIPIAPTTTTKEMGVDDLYQYALSSPRFRSAEGEDAEMLRRLLSSRHPALKRKEGRILRLEEGVKQRAAERTGSLELL